MPNDFNTSPTLALACKLRAMAADLRARAAAETENERRRGVEHLRGVLASVVDSIRRPDMREELELIGRDLDFIARCLAAGDVDRAVLALAEVRGRIAEALASSSPTE